MKGKFQKKSANILKKKYWRLIIEFAPHEIGEGFFKIS